MKKVTRRLSIMVAILMVFSVILTGCGDKKQAESTAETKVSSDTSASNVETTKGSDKPDTSKKVTLKMYMLGDKQADHDLVWGEINKRLEQSINATIDVNLLGWGEWDQKYPLLFASGDDFDLIYTANWAKYVDQTVKGGFLALSEDMLKKYAAKTYENVPQDAWKQVKVNGKIYMVPSNYVENAAFTYMIRGDLREKYGLPEVNSLDNYEKYLDGIAKNEKSILPYGDNNGNTYWILTTTMLNYPRNWMTVNCGGVDMMHFDYSDPNSKPFFRYDKPEYLELIKKVTDWRKKGYWSNSALTAKTGRTELFKSGKSASAIDNLGSANGIYSDWKKNHPEWKLELYNASFGTKVAMNSYLGNGMAINARSKNPERALMAIDNLSYDHDTNYLLRFGIKGKHYDLTSDGKLLSGPEGGKYSSGYSIWSFNVKPVIISVESHPKYEELLKAQNDKAVSHPLDAFVLNTENLKTEYAACKAIFDQYQPILELGFSKDPDKDIKDFVEKLKAAGFDKIKQEIETQTSAFAAQFNK